MYITFSNKPVIHVCLICNLLINSAVSTIQDGGSYLDAIEKGCSQCEIDQCDGSVGYGGR